MKREPQSCGCGCGGMTKGGRFLPGHDARMHGHKKTEERVRQRMAGPVPTTPLEFASGRVAKDGTRAGAWVRGKTVKGEATGVVSYVSPFGWLVLVDDEGHQWILHQWEVMDGGTMTPAQHHRLARLAAA